jgi:uncharacterized protein YukE
MGFIGSANSSAETFVGVNVKEARAYVKDICGTAIKAAISAAKETKTVFNALEDGWTGQAIENFEYNYAKAVLRLEKTLAKAFAALVKQIAAITDAMVEQDKKMVDKI